MKELAEKLKVAFEQLQESSAYQTLEEKYISLPPKTQKAVLAGCMVLAILVVLMPTYSFFSSSQSQQAAFLKDRQLMRELLQAASLPRSPVAAGSSFDQAQQLALQMAQNSDLLPEQITPPSPQPASSVENLSSLKQQVFEWSLKQLTLTQLVNLGQNIDKQPTLKLMGLDIQASNEDAHYFDVRFQVVHFELPAPPPQQKGAPSKGPRQPPTKGTKSKGTKSSGLTSPKPPYFNPAQGVSS